MGGSLANRAGGGLAPGTDSHVPAGDDVLGRDPSRTPGVDAVYSRAPVRGFPLGRLVSELGGQAFAQGGADVVVDDRDGHAAARRGEERDVAHGVSEELGEAPVALRVGACSAGDVLVGRDVGHATNAPAKSGRALVDMLVASEARLGGGVVWRRGVRHQKKKTSYLYLDFVDTEREKMRPVERFAASQTRGLFSWTCWILSATNSLTVWAGQGRKMHFLELHRRKR